MQPCRFLVQMGLRIRIPFPPALSQVRTRPKASAICLLRVGSPLVLSSVHWVRSELVAVAEPVEDAAANSVPVRFAKAGAGIRGIFSRADSFLDLPCAPTKAAVDRGDIR